MSISGIKGMELNHSKGKIDLARNMKRMKKEGYRSYLLEGMSTSGIKGMELNHSKGKIDLARNMKMMKNEGYKSYLLRIKYNISLL